MTNPITITGKRTWKEGKFTYMECYCNGMRIADRCEGDSDVRFMIERQKNSCKLVKLFGEPMYKMGRLVGEEHRIFLEETLPEWELDESPEQE